jgi:hypothetical protein
MSYGETVEGAQATGKLPGKRKSLTLHRGKPSLAERFTVMADNTPSVPGGSVPPKPPEPSKVQPKKETVRISLPPKPSAAPTIKLPSVPTAAAPASAAPTTGTAASGAPAALGAPAAPRPATSAPASGGASGITRPPTSTGPAASRPPSPTPAPRPQAPAVKRVSGLDVGLAIAAAVVALAAVASVALLLQLK